MTTRGAYVNTWDNEGKLATTKNGTAAAGLNVYDADGNRLLRRNPDTSTTLYLADTEITLGISTVTPKVSQRWYQFGGKTIATRTSAGLTMLAADHHGTGEAQLDATTNNYIRRKFTPFGAARTGGVTVGGVTWRGDHGFLEKPVDANSGLSQIGARFYDNSLGTFISVDPLLDTADTHQANAYVYSKNSPMSNSDPDGMRSIGDWDSGPSRGNSGAGGSGTQTTTTTTTTTSTTNSSSPAPSVTQNQYSLARDVIATGWSVVSINAAVFESTYTSLAAGSAVGAAVSTYGRHAGTGRFSRFTALSKTGEYARSAYNIRSGNFVAPRYLSALNRVDWDKASKVFDNKLVKGAGITGAVLGAANSFNKHNESETTTEAAINAGIETAITAGVAAGAGALGAACGPAAAVCGAALGAAGAYAGAKFASAVTAWSPVQSGVGWSADKIDSFAGAAREVDWSFWD